MALQLRADEIRLLIKTDQHPEHVTCCVRDTRIGALTVLDEGQSFVMHLDGGTAWWINTNDEIDDGVEVDNFEMTGTMHTMPPDLWARYTGTLKRWADDGTSLSYISTDEWAILHDGTTPVPLPVKPYPEAPADR